jgi:hypothetical protein
MNWLKRLLSGEQKAEKVTSATRERPKAVIEIPNSYGHFDSSPLLVERSPDLNKILSDPNPPVIQKLSDANRAYWSAASVSERRMTAAIGYLQHPNPEVRRAVMAFVPPNPPVRVAQVLVDRLGGDPDLSVRIAAAETIWECERKENCESTVSCLKDEIEYGTEQSMVGPTRARKALQLLVEHAPDHEAKDALQKLINQ